MGDNTQVLTGNIALNLRRVPGFVQGITTAVSITCGFCHSCVLKASGQPLCWGCNYQG